MLIFGAILFVLGALLCITIIGSIIGVPLMFIGGIFMTIGMFTRRRTVITNVVQVANAPQQPIPHAPAQPAPAQFRSDTLRQPEPRPAVAEAQPSAMPEPGKACPKCAWNNALESRFCTECGEQFQTS